MWFSREINMQWSLKIPAERFQSRKVYDLDANKSFQTFKMEGNWIYTIDTIPLNSPFSRNQISGLDILYHGSSVAPGKIDYKGFSCYNVTMLSKDYGKVTLWATNQVKIPSKGFTEAINPIF
jgi:hypothetical protein